MTRYIYRVRGWEDHYENNRTRGLKHLEWLPLPTDLSSDGYTWIMSHQDGPAHYAVWIGILQIAARCTPRGTLIRATGEPHDAESIARITRIDVATVENALNTLSSKCCGWLTRSNHRQRKQQKTTDEVPHSDAPQGAVIPHLGAVLGREGTEGTEGKTHEQRARAATPLKPCEIPRAGDNPLLAALSAGQQPTQAERDGPPDVYERSQAIGKAWPRPERRQQGIRAIQEAVAEAADKERTLAMIERAADAWRAYWRAGNGIAKSLHSWMLDKDWMDDAPKSEVRNGRPDPNAWMEGLDA